MDQDNDSPIPSHLPIHMLNYPIRLYESLLGRYFTGETPHLHAGSGTGAWGALVNPPDSGVNLHVNVVALNFIRGEPMTIGFYLNADLLGCSHEIRGVVANTAILPLPRPKVYLQYASESPGIPRGGEFAFSRTAYPDQVTMFEEDGAFIIPPGGSYCAFVHGLTLEQGVSVIYLAFGWWEEPVQDQGAG